MPNCKNCRAPILWVPNNKTRTVAPIDFEPNPRGNIVIVSSDRDSTYRVLGNDELLEAKQRDVPLFTNHFMTCPAASEFRRR